MHTFCLECLVQRFRATFLTHLSRPLRIIFDVIVHCGIVYNLKSKSTEHYHATSESHPFEPLLRAPQQLSCILNYLVLKYEMKC